MPVLFYLKQSRLVRFLSSVRCKDQICVWIWIFVAFGNWRCFDFGHSEFEGSLYHRSRYIWSMPVQSNPWGRYASQWLGTSFTFYDCSFFFISWMQWLNLEIVSFEFCLWPFHFFQAYAFAFFLACYFKMLLFIYVVFAGPVFYSSCTWGKLHVVW